MTALITLLCVFTYLVGMAFGGRAIYLYQVANGKWGRGYDGFEDFMLVMFGSLFWWITGFYFFVTRPTKEDRRKNKLEEIKKLEIELGIRPKPKTREYYGYTETDYH